MNVLHWLLRILITNNQIIDSIQFYVFSEDSEGARCKEVVELE